MVLYSLATGSGEPITLPQNDKSQTPESARKVLSSLASLRKVCCICFED
jgi:hypothetical protein